jgi:D-glycero-D-manno-heptose 1,7-bisphosphate phosphatase
LFLDRDGVVNVNRGYVHRPADTEWVPGIFELARAARDAGFVLVVVTNQAGIARGYYSVDQFRDFTRWIHLRFDEEGAPLLATYFCPHHPTDGIGEWKLDCGCRKPAPGMLLAAAAEWDIDLADSMMIGDNVSDVAAAAEAGVGFAALVRSGDLAAAISGMRLVASRYPGHRAADGR